MKPSKTKNKPKITYHTNWICPKCKEIYNADGWAELNVKQAQLQTKLECLKDELEFLIKLREDLERHLLGHHIKEKGYTFFPLVATNERISKIQQEIKEIEK